MYVMARNESLREVADVTVKIEKMLWSDGGETWDVYHQGTGLKLSKRESFLQEPTDQQIIDLLELVVGYWVCQGCGHRFRDPVEHAEHTRGCDLSAFVHYRYLT